MIVLGRELLQLLSIASSTTRSGLANQEQIDFSNGREESSAGT